MATKTNGPAPAEAQERADHGPDLTIFSAPKAFRDHIGLIQRNAVRSWVALGPRVEVILLGTDEGVAEIAAEFGLRHVADIDANDYGTPLLNSMMEKAKAAASAPFLCMINADIILTRDLLTFLDRLPALPPALYIGLRSDIDLFDAIDFDDPQWESKLLDRVKTDGRFRGRGDDSFNGTDYYIYPRDLYETVPPFAIGRFFWDSWLIAEVLRKGGEVVDASHDLLAIHQNHNYGHVKSGGNVDFYEYWKNPELNANFQLAGGFSDLMGPRDASQKLEYGELKPAGGGGLAARRKYNLWYYRPTILRRTFPFTTRIGEKFWGHIYQFDNAAGRHTFRRSGIPRFFVYEVAKPVWKVLPAFFRENAHVAVRNPRHFARIVKHDPLRLLGRKPRQFGIVLDAEMQMTQAAEPVLDWIRRHCREGERALVPKPLQPLISAAFGSGFFAARRTWRDADLDFDYAVLARAEIEHLPAALLRLLWAHFHEVYRDEAHCCFHRTGHKPELHGAPWPELANRFAEQDGPVGDIIAVLNVWKRGPELLRRQIAGLQRQTLRPRQIWVCALGLEDAEIYEGVVREFCDPDIHIIRSTKNFKYHGRFQLGLFAEQSFIAFIDDDIIIGRDFLRRCLSTLEGVEDAGEVGMYGWRRLPGPRPDGTLPHYTTGEFIEHLPPERKDIGLVPVDMLCGFHFTRTAYLKYLFREEPWTWATGEDFQLAFALRKYAGRRSYVIPVDPNNPDSWGLSHDWLAIREHASTVGDMDAIRDTLYWRLLNAGHVVNWMEEADAGTQAVRKTVLAIFDTPVTARRASRALEQVEGATPDTVLAVFAGQDKEFSARSLEMFGVSPQDRRQHRFSAIDLEIWRDTTSLVSRAVRAERLIYALTSLAEGLKPETIVLASDDPALRSALTVALEGSDIALVAAS